MPGWELDPNVNAAKTLAFDFNLSGRQEQTFGQFPTVDSDVKVQNFFVRGRSINVSVKFDVTEFPEAS